MVKLKKRLKKEVIKKYGHECYICGRTLGIIFLMQDDPDIKFKKVYGNKVYFTKNGIDKVLPLCTIDHIRPASKGGNNSIENLRPCCGDCNVKKSNKFKEL